LFLGLLQHFLRQVDPRDRTVRGVEGEIEPGAYPHLEDLMAALGVEQADRRLPPRMEDPVEDEIVGRSVEFVGSLDLPCLQRCVHDESPLGNLGLRPVRGLPSKEPIAPAKAGALTPLTSRGLAAKASSR